MPFIHILSFLFTDKQAVNNPVESCACHGISGTCSVQTCYLKVPAVSSVGEDLVTKYDGAIRVEQNSENELVRADNIGANPLTMDDLTFVEESPDLCVADTSNNILGTVDRVCDPSPGSPKSCAVLCCSRGFYTKTTTYQLEECQFVFCCNIECTYTKNVTEIEYKCNP